MLTLQYGNYTFTLTPELEIESKVQSIENNTRLGVSENWRLKGYLAGNTATALNTLIANFNAAFGNDEQDLILKQGALTLLSLTASECWKSPKILKSKIYADDENGAPFTQYVKFELEIYGFKPEKVGNVLSEQCSMKFSEDSKKKVSKTVEGEFKAAAGYQASVLLDTVLPAVAAGFRRVEKTYKTDSDDTVLQYKIIDETEFSPLPSGVFDGYIVETEEYSDKGNYKLMQGVFYGPQAKEQALALKPVKALVDMKISENAQEQKVEFEYRQQIEACGNGMLRKYQRISYQTKLSFKDLKLISPNSADIRQLLGNPDFFIVQEGKAEKANSYPSPEKPSLPADVIDRKITYEYPEGSGEQKIYVTSWYYLIKPLHKPFERKV